MNSLTPYLMTVLANLLFGAASILFSDFARKKSPFWINQIKAAVGFVGFILAWFLFEPLWSASLGSTLCLLLSGFFGLCVADSFLFRAFLELGTARSLTLFSFQPFLIAVYGFFFLNQTLNPIQLAGILCMVGCVYTFLHERNKTTGSWGLMSFGFAFLGIIFDSLGIMLSRQAYEWSSNLGPFQLNATRAFGAMLGFALLRPHSYSKVFKDVLLMEKRERNLLLTACFLGTFLSLWLYLGALKTAHVATLTSIAVTLPVWVSLIEHVREKSLPNRYFLAAFFLFVLGFFFMAWDLSIRTK